MHLNTQTQAWSDITLALCVCLHLENDAVRGCVSVWKKSWKADNDLRNKKKRKIWKQIAGPSMTSGDNRLRVDFSGAGDSSAPQAWRRRRRGISAARRDGNMKKKKSELRELWLCLTRSMIEVTSTAVLTGGSVARSVKNESRHWCGIIMSTFYGGGKKNPHW